MNNNQINNNLDINEQKNIKSNENKGRGLFYGVIAVATFIIMAVGATFAYFTATTNSMNSAVRTGSTTLQLKYISYGSAWSRNDLIPADTTIVEYSVENQSDATTSTNPSAEGEAYPINGNNTICKDDYGNSICSIYVFQVENSAPSPQTVSLNIISEKNGFASLNAMAYEISIPTDRTEYDDIATETDKKANGVNDPIFRKGTDDTTENSIDVVDANGALLDNTQYTPVFINRKGVVKTLLQYIESRDAEAQTVVKKPAIDRLLVPLLTTEDENKATSDRTSRIADNIEINGGETKTFAVILYIKNANTDQTASDADKTFQGKVVVSTGDGTSGVSGVISAMGDDTSGLQSSQQTSTVEP